jgi:dipeptidase E
MKKTPQRLLLLSNSRNPNGGWLDHVEPLIRDLIGEGRRKILFLPFAGVTITFDAYVAMARKRFAQMGYTVTGAHKTTPAAIGEFDAIVAGGGNTFQLLAETRARKWLAPIRSRVRAGVPFMGWSAGANLACPTIRTTNDMPVVDPKGFEALDLVPFQINPHYTELKLKGHGGESRDDRIVEFLKVNPKVAVLGIREGSLVKVEGDKAKLLLGPGARLFRQGAKPRDLKAGADLSALLKRPSK